MAIGVVLTPGVPPAAVGVGHIPFVLPAQTKLGTIVAFRFTLSNV